MTVYGAATLVPLSLVISALLIEYVPGKIGLVGTLLCFFANGVGVRYFLCFMSFILQGMRWSCEAEQFFDLV